ncbi:MAG: hypothetical protein methR_P2198 [Methyloprofundus sp.]|nr:MAG: hypothetical protein methR_P2198 [Methyloprofundus sp.]
MRFLLIVFIILASYGSLYPFDFKLSAHPGTTFLSPLWANTTNAPSISDILGNIALFLPLGIIIALQNKQNHFKNLFLFFAGIAFATILQVLQLYTPSRDPNLLDVIWNIAGIVAGVFIGSIFSRLGNHTHSNQVDFNIELLLIGSWITFQLIPFVPTLDIGLIWENIKQLRPPFQFSILIFLTHFSGWLVVGFLLKKAIPNKQGHLLSLVVLITFLAKFFILDATINISSYLAGFSAIIVSYLILSRPPFNATPLIILLVLSIISKGIFPLEFNTYTKSFNWVPFYGFLTGSMLINAQNLLEKIFIYGSLLWLIPQHIRYVFALALVILTTSIEFFQMFLIDHTAEITDPILILMIVFSMKFLPSTQAKHNTPNTKKTIPETTETTETTNYRRQKSPYLQLLIIIVAITLGLKLFLSLPQLPYNIRELFLNGGSLPRLFCFSLFLVWFAISGSLLSKLSSNSIKNTILLLPIGIVFCAVSFALIKLSVSYESLSDILGSLLIQTAIENEGLWGSFGHTLLTFPSLIDKFERYVRFIALIAPLTLAMCFWVTLFRFKSLTTKPQLIVFIQATTLLVTFFIAKFIVIDNAATDNLTELIAENGMPFLGALILLLTCNAAYLSRKPINIQITRISNYLLSITAVIIGWYLLNLGLAETINKYDDTFSGVDFLLGPNRKELLASSTLFIRWSLLYFSLVLLLNLGSRLTTFKPLQQPPSASIQQTPIVNKSRRRSKHRYRKHKYSNNQTIKFNYKQINTTYTSIAAALILFLIILMSNEEETSFNTAENKKVTLPEASSLPNADILGFRMQHPRLPAPSAIEIEQLMYKNPSFIHSVRSIAKKGSGRLYQAILAARIQPNAFELNTIYSRLINLQFEGRGNVQATPIAQAYDWLYPYWSMEQKLGLQQKLIEGCHYLTNFIREETLSPYNVYLYNSPFQALMATAIAIYKDTPQGQVCMNFTYDLWKNRVLPVWRQVMGKNGGWHEGNEYVGIGIGKAIYQVPAMWRKATGEDLFNTEVGLRGFLDFLIYRTRPDGTHMRWGDGAFFDRKSPDKIALAIEYNHKAAYSLGGCPKPFKPSLEPWGPTTTDTLCDPKSINKMPLTQHFDGIGMVIARSDWTKEATYVVFKAGNNYWSHAHLDQGAFTIYKGGPLAIDSGLYGPRYGSDHHMNYSYQSIAHNVITITDNNDNLPLPDKKNKGKFRAIANDGGQRRIGSGWGESAPIDFTDWLNKKDTYQAGKIEKYYADDNFVIAIADLTAAYTNKKSGSGTFRDRTRRVKRYWRTFVYDRANDIVLVFDNITATNANFTKRSIFHTINQPYLHDNKVVAQTYYQKNYPAQKGGTLEATVLFPKQAFINIVGGKNKEFLVQNKNYDENGGISAHLKKRDKNKPEPGAWRVEVIPPLAQQTDYFLTVYNPKLSGENSSINIEAIESATDIGSKISGAVQNYSIFFSKQQATLKIKFASSLGRYNIEL